VNFTIPGDVYAAIEPEYLAAGLENALAGIRIEKAHPYYLEGTLEGGLQ
jgi:hypothetical protein